MKYLGGTQHRNIKRSTNCLYNLPEYLSKRQNRAANRSWIVPGRQGRHSVWGFRADFSMEEAPLACGLVEPLAQDHYKTYERQIANSPGQVNLDTGCLSHMAQHLSPTNATSHMQLLSIYRR